MVDFKRLLAERRAKAEPLADRITAIGKSQAVDLNAVSRRVKKEPEIIPDISEVLELGETRRVKTLVAKAVEQKLIARNAKNAAEPLVAQIKSFFEDRTKVMVGETRLTYFNMQRRSISADLLRAAGVSQTIINDCTVKSDNWVLKLSLPGQETDDDE